MNQYKPDYSCPVEKDNHSSPWLCFQGRVDSQRIWGTRILYQRFNFYHLSSICTVTPILSICALTIRIYRVDGYAAVFSKAEVMVLWYYPYKFYLFLMHGCHALWYLLIISGRIVSSPLNFSTASQKVKSAVNSCDPYISLYLLLYLYLHLCPKVAWWFIAVCWAHHLTA